MEGGKVITSTFLIILGLFTLYLTITGKIDCLTTAFYCVFQGQGAQAGGAPTQQRRTGGGLPSLPQLPNLPTTF